MINATAQNLKAHYTVSEFAEIVGIQRNAHKSLILAVRTFLGLRYRANVANRVYFLGSKAENSFSVEKQVKTDSISRDIVKKALKFLGKDRDKECVSITFVSEEDRQDMKKDFFFWEKVQAGCPDTTIDELLRMVPELASLTEYLRIVHRGKKGAMSRAIGTEIGDMVKSELAFGNAIGALQNRTHGRLKQYQGEQLDLWISIMKKYFFDKVIDSSAMTAEQFLLRMQSKGVSEDVIADFEITISRLHDNFDSSFANVYVPIFDIVLNPEQMSVLLMDKIEDQ